MKIWRRYFAWKFSQLPRPFQINEDECLTACSNNLDHANTTCQHLLNRFVTTCSHFCYNLCVFKRVLVTFLSVLMDDCKDCNWNVAHCFHGKCACKPGYVGDGQVCVPKSPGKYHELILPWDDSRDTTQPEKYKWSFYRSRKFIHTHSFSFSVSILLYGNSKSLSYCLFLGFIS